MGDVQRLRVLEADAQTTILDLAAWRRWRVAHFHDSRREVKPGVHVGDKLAAGYPDLTLVRDRVVFAELKRVGEKPRRDQVEWLDELAAAGAEVYLWTIDDLSEIGMILDRRSWRFVAFGDITTGISGGEFAGPVLHDDAGRHIFSPRSAWIPGHGRRDA